MKLKSFGCSFIFGSDLADDRYNQPMSGPSWLTWPALLSKKIGKRYECYAVPGSGNLQILEHVLNQIPQSSSDDLFVIGWTWIDRFDWYDSANYNPRYQKTPWHTLMPSEDSELAKMYYKNLHSEYSDKFTSLSYIKLAADSLSQKGIPFLMTYIDELLFDQKWHVSPAVIDLQSCVRPLMTKFEDLTFLDWSRKNGFPESKAWHPLEPAHSAAADYMFKIFDKQKTNDPTRLVLV